MMGVAILSFAVEMRKVITMAFRQCTMTHVMIGRNDCEVIGRKRRAVDKLAIGIGVIIGACSAIFAQNVMILREIRHMWLSINRVQDAELKVLKLSKERIDAHMEALSNINDSQVAIANMILLLTEIEKGKEQNAGQSRCREDFSDKTDVSVTESGSDGRKEN